MGIINRKNIKQSSSISDYNYGNSILVGYFKNKPKGLSGAKYIQENITNEKGDNILCYVQVLSILKNKTIEEYLEENKEELINDELVKIEIFKKESSDIFPSLF